MAELKGIVRGNTTKIAQQTIDKDKIYGISDIQGASLTNAQMASLILPAQEGLIKPKSIWVCSDNGTYEKGHLYQFTPDYANSGAIWVDVTAGGAPIATTISSTSTNAEVAGAKAVYDYIQSLNATEVSY